VIVAGPWYAAMYALHGNLFVQGFLEANNLTRYLKPEHVETQSWSYFIPVSRASSFPGLWRFLSTVADLWKTRLSPDARAAGQQRPDSVFWFCGLRLSFCSFRRRRRSW